MGGRFSEAEWEDGERLGDEGRGGAGGSSGGQGENEEGDPRGRKVRGMRRGWE